MRRVRVHHFVLANLVRPENPTWRASDLFHVTHWIDVPEDTEFPYTISRIHLFARFYIERARSTTFRIRLLWEDHPSGTAEEIGIFGPYTAPFGRGESVHDRSFNLHNVQLRGVGLHTVELFRERAIAWTENEWVPIASTYFIVER